MGKIGNFGSHHPSNPADDAKVQNWYNHPWDAVLRPTNQELANLSANMQIEACNNNNVIYIFGGQSYHQRLAEAGYNPSAITTQCGTDCMGSVFANIKGACARLGISTDGVPNMGTFNADSLMKIGYQKFTDPDHVRTDAHAQRGDVYVSYAQHACMHVGDGNVDGSSTGGSLPGGSNANLNIEAMSPYVLKIPENDVTFDIDKFVESQICGLAFSAGYLYSSGTHIEQKSYINPNLHAQVERANKLKVPFALIAEVRARTVGEAQKECGKLYYVCASAVPAMSLWLHLDFTTSKDSNHRILDYYIEQCSKWGFKNTLGVYVTKKELEKIDWDKYSEKLYLWRVDHTLDINKYVGVLPFSTYTGNIGGNTSGTGGVVGTGGQEYQAANAKQKAIVNACKTTPSPGAGYCAAWITYVYMKAGAGHPTGNACDMYWKYCTSSDRSQLKVGMLVAVPSHPGTSAGRIYGHVAIYIGDGQVMENIGPINTQSLDSWIAYYGKTHTPKWGFGGTGIA